MSRRHASCKDIGTRGMGKSFLPVNYTPTAENDDFFGSHDILGHFKGVDIALGVEGSRDNIYYSEDYATFWDAYCDIAPINTGTTFVINTHIPFDRDQSGAYGIPEWMAIKVVKGGLLEHGVYDLDIGGPFPDPGLIQCFSGSGLVTFGNFITEGIPQWFGAVPDFEDGNTDNHDAIQACINALGAGNSKKTFILPGGKYLFGSKISCNFSRVNVNMIGQLIADDFAGVAFEANPGPGNYISQKTYTLNIRRKTDQWFNGAGKKYDDGSWVIENVGVRLINFNDCIINVTAIGYFGIGLDAYADDAGWCYNVINQLKYSNNQICVRLYKTGTGWVNENLWLNGNWKVFSGKTNQSRYGCVIDGNGYTHNNNVFIKPSCENNASDVSANEEGPVFLLIGAIDNKAYWVRGEGAESMARIENSSSGTNSSNNRFISGASSACNIIDNSTEKLNFAERGNRGYGSGEFSERFVRPLCNNTDLYSLVRRRSSTYLQVAGFQLRYCGNTYKYRTLDGFTIDHINKTICFPSQNGIGITLEGLQGSEEFLLVVHSPTNHAGRTLVRVYDSTGTPIITGLPVLGITPNCFYYRADQNGWYSDLCYTQQNSRIKLNDSNIASAEIFCIGAGGGDDAEIDTFQIYADKNTQNVRAFPNYSGVKDSNITLYSEYVPFKGPLYEENQICLSTTATIDTNNRVSIGWVCTGLKIRNATYRWTLSTGGGTNEYYCELAAGGDPSLTGPDGCIIDGNPVIEGTGASLALGEWDYGDFDTLGYNTIYVKLEDETDPDTKAIGYVKGLYWKNMYTSIITW